VSSSALYGGSRAREVGGIFRVAVWGSLPSSSSHLQPSGFISLKPNLFVTDQIMLGHTPFITDIRPSMWP